MKKQANPPQDVALGLGTRLQVHTGLHFAVRHVNTFWGRLRLAQMKLSEGRPVRRYKYELEKAGR